MYTFGGRLTEPRASLLASKGFVVLALAYIGYMDLPRNPQKLDLEYFEEAVTFLRKQTEVSVDDQNRKDNHLYTAPQLFCIYFELCVPFNL